MKIEDHFPQFLSRMQTGSFSLIETLGTVESGLEYHLIWRNSNFQVILHFYYQEGENLWTAKYNEKGRKRKRKKKKN